MRSSSAIRAEMSIVKAQIDEQKALLGQYEALKGSVSSAASSISRSNFSECLMLLHKLGHLIRDRELKI